MTRTTVCSLQRSSRHKQDMPQMVSCILKLKIIKKVFSLYLLVGSAGRGGEGEGRPATALVTDTGLTQPIPIQHSFGLYTKRFCKNFRRTSGGCRVSPGCPLSLFVNLFAPCPCVSFQLQPVYSSPGTSQLLGRLRSHLIS